MPVAPLVRRRLSPQTGHAAHKRRGSRLRQQYHKVRQWAHNLRRPAHLPGAPPPPPVPLSPPYARATLVPRRAAVLSPRKQARLPCADRRTLSAPTGGSAHFICPKRRMLCAPRPQFMCGTGASYVHSYTPGQSSPSDAPPPHPARGTTLAPAADAGHIAPPTTRINTQEMRDEQQPASHRHLRPPLQPR